MNQAPKSITIDEPPARRLMLAQAIESSDPQGKLLSPVEREEVDRLALQSARKGLPAHNGVTALTDANVQAFLQERATQVLRITENRNPALASLQQASAWTHWLGWAAFLGAGLLGTVSDRIANPHRVDLLSLPLLAILAWNLVVHGALIASYFLHRQRQRPEHPAPTPLLRWAGGWHNWHRRAGQLRTQVTALFVRNWYGATAALQAQRGRKVLHLAAAGWAFGIALSIVTRGLVVEYRVGWESTLLNADQVHAILRVLLLPAMALFPFQGFTVQDIASLQFGNISSGSGAVAGARWVYLYATLLAVVVILPRLGLAMYAAWRERVLSRRIVVNLNAPYYKRLLAVLNPTRIQLGLVALREEDRAALLRILHPRPKTLQTLESGHEGALALLRTSTGEELFLARTVSVSQQPPLQAPVPNNPAGWGERIFGRLLPRRAASPPAAQDSLLQSTPDDSDALLLVVQNADDIEAALPLPVESGKSTLLLVNAAGRTEADAEVAVARCRTQARALGLYAEVIGFNSFAKCWVQDPVLLEALARSMPSHKKESFARLADAWLSRNQTLFAKSMQLIATQLFNAAREVEEVRSALPYVKRLISPSDRQADTQARKDAMAAVAERLQRALRHTHVQLLRLHGIDDAQGALLEQPLKEKFDFQAPINAKEAGFAGAATGAASGASIDLVTGGMTLGVAAALGALIGGGAAFAGAAWKNRATSAGTTLVQLSDDMLQAMTAAALLRYLALAHLERSASDGESQETLAGWENKVVAAVEATKDSLIRFWAEARQPQGKPPAIDDLTAVLQTTLRSVLERLYPGSHDGQESLLNLGLPEQ
ncbi:hypothetical protein RCH06_001881 [Polaromonas sp. CG_9.5]|uniref:DUF3482 domain-containing protein n=1 Tax=Polaromonas sp. CG_9.5 TaxID=3071705 RepID=UPI002E0C18C3|nr:hypothetical protein [Polaromonas sp. CG_9.5]